MGIVESVISTVALVAAVVLIWGMVPVIRQESRSASRNLMNGVIICLLSYFLYRVGAILIGAVTLALAVALLLVNPAYSLEYAIKEAGATFTLTGITIGVGLFGGYAAIVAVFLGIAGFSPRRTSLTPADTGVNASTTPTAEPGDAPARPAGETA